MRSLRIGLPRLKGVEPAGWTHSTISPMTHRRLSFFPCASDPAFEPIVWSEKSRVSITVITGPPGAGKTTVAGSLARSSTLGVHLVADQCFHWIVSGFVAPWSPGADWQNHTVIGAIGAAAARYAEGGYDVVVDGIVGPWFFAQFEAALAPQNEELRYVILRPSREITLGRAIARRGEADLVDRGPINAMYDAFEDLGVFESHVIDSSTQDMTATIAALRGGLDGGTFILSDRHRVEMAQLAQRQSVSAPESDEAN